MAVSQSTITACVATGAGDTTMRYSTSGSCGGGQQAITWNEAGPQGTAGAQGPAGPPGPAGRDALGATQVVIWVNSAVNKNPIHSATASCQGNSRFLYGGWGLIGTTDPTMERIVVTQNQPQIGDRGAPVGWRVRATRHRPNNEAGALLSFIRASAAAAREEKINTNGGHNLIYEYGLGGTDISNLQTNIWKEALAHFDSAVVAAKKASNLNPTAAWGVNAWAVCAND